VNAPRIICKNFEALVDRALLHENGLVRVLSIVGSREAARAIWARTVQGEGALISDHGEYARVVVRDAAMRQQRLPCGSMHLLITAQRVMDGLTIIARDDAELEERIWAAVQRHCATPLHADWKAFALAQVKTSSLRVFGEICGCDLGPLEGLGASVRQAVKEGTLCA
jgi:hypothetical protein